MREPIENDEDRLAMKRGNMPPPLPHRVANPSIREDQASQEFHSNSDTMHRATPDEKYTQAWFDYSRSFVPQSVRKEVQTLNISTCRRPSAASNNMGSFNRKSEFQKSENLNKPITKGEKFNVADVWLKEFGNQLRACDFDSRS